MTTQIFTLIKKKRVEKNFSQEYVAFEMGISQAAYAKIESGKTCPSIDRINELSKILNINLFKYLAKDISENIDEEKEG